MKLLHPKAVKKGRAWRGIGGNHSSGAALDYKPGSACNIFPVFHLLLPDQELVRYILLLLL
jgi:hypothetical protein